MRVRFPAAVAVAVAVAGFAAGGHAQSLEEALASAYNNNPTLAAERAGLRAIDEQVPQALSNWRPDVTVSGSFDRTDTFANRRAVSGGTDQIRDERSVDFTVSQPLFRGFRTLAATRQAENSVKAARARLLGVEQDVFLDGATAYMDVVRDQAVLDLTINNEQVLRRQLEATEDRFRVGELTRTDVSQAKARLAGATADRVRAEGDLENTRATYRNIIGAVPGRLKAPQAFADLPVSRDASISMANANHPDVTAALFDEKSARDRVREVRGELLPTVTLNGSLSRDWDTSGTNTRFDRKSIGAALTVPLYQSGSVFSRLREAKQTAGQERLQVDRARRDVIEAATQAWESLVTARARIASFAAQVEANEIALEGVQREAEVGARTVLDILDAEQELLDAKVNLVRAQRDHIVAIFDLKEATGQLTARKMNLSVDVYDPTAHYREVRGHWFGGSSSGEMDPAGTRAK